VQVILRKIVNAAECAFERLIVFLSGYKDKSGRSLIGFCMWDLVKIYKKADYLNAFSFGNQSKALGFRNLNWLGVD
jgi:hypothetical protein